MSKPSLEERITGGVLGLLIGDALGVPYEFRSPEQIPLGAPFGFSPPSGFDRAHVDVPPGTWSDDGAQALCLMASLLEIGRFDASDFSHRLVRWYDEGYLAVDGIVFDVGVTTGRAIISLKSGVPPLKAGPEDVLDNGNGSLMRVLPLALWHKGSVEQLIMDAHDQSAVTHGHPRSKVCCALYSVWARMILLDAPEPWSAAVEALRKVYDPDSVFTEELEWSIRPDEIPVGTGSGYVVDSIRSSRIAADKPTFREAMVTAISFGNDTDTTACIAGGIAGIRLGAEAIPLEWRQSLRGKELLEPLLARFLNETSHHSPLIHPLK